jgi:hypothetical protein
LNNGHDEILYCIETQLNNFPGVFVVHLVRFLEVHILCFESVVSQAQLGKKFWLKIAPGQLQFEAYTSVESWAHVLLLLVIGPVDPKQLVNQMNLLSY